MQSKNFIVYKSSAGSGKTHALVKEYLKLVLAEPVKFRNILAITFTNKAANEMKQRILKNLKEISEYEQFSDTPAVKYMLKDLAEETGLERELLAGRASAVLRLILHNYTDFAISTIDSFVHRIIRSFAFDLKLPVNFEVEMDTDEFIEKIIDLLLSKVGVDEDLTQILIEFTRSKTDDDKSWNIDRELQEFAKILLKEDSQIHIGKLRKLTLPDFTAIRSKIIVWLKKFEKDLKQMAHAALDLIREKNISEGAFYQGGKGIVKYFEYIISGRFDKLQPNSFVQTTIESDKWFSGKANPSEMAAIEQIKGELTLVINKIFDYRDQHFKRYVLLNEINKNLYPLALLNEIEKVIGDYKAENQVILISEFNKKIAEVVMSEPVPFIYERTGEKFKHYLIDEFQDTSELQWQNLIPLLDNSLAENKFNMIVGDGKQAIYRWRNGDVEQFARLPELYSEKSDPINVQREMLFANQYSEFVLEKNYRSKENIIQFNNTFFSYLMNTLAAPYDRIYRDVIQQADKNKKGGYISVEFLANDNREDFEILNLSKVLATIEDLKSDGYYCKDIAVLCRNNNQASQVAAHLLQHKVPVVSSESLLLGNSPKVRFLIAALKYLSNTSDQIAIVEMVHFILKRKGLADSFHQTMNNLLADLNSDKKEQVFNKWLIDQGYNFRMGYLLNQSLYDLSEELIRIFQFKGSNDPYIQFFLDTVLKISKDGISEPAEVIEWWEENKHKLSIIVPEGLDAVSVMTIHKAKGLEFPVVIFPFAIEKHRKTRNKLWIEPNDPEIPELKTALVDTGKSLLDTDFEGLFTEEDAKSLIDLYNILYVVFTRPTDRLYIVSSIPPEKTDSAVSVPVLLKGFLIASGIWNEGQVFYEFGEKTKPPMEQNKAETGYELNSFISDAWQDRLILSYQAPVSWEVEEPVQMQEWGSLVHEVLSEVILADDLPAALERKLKVGEINEEELEQLSGLLSDFISDPDVVPFFREGLKIKTEPELISKNGDTFRPDRLILDQDSVTVVDFKTGKKEQKHLDQVSFYIKMFRSMGYQKVKGVLLYINLVPPVLWVNN